MDISKVDYDEPTQTKCERMDRNVEGNVLSVDNGLWIDPAMEKRVKRKIDYVLIPLVTGLCGFYCHHHYIDRFLIASVIVTNYRFSLLSRPLQHR
ncbi:hypothetical protein F4779DRAFT_583415 [Xylariaceae sp. FL0662B]|nr:hypothetical protein F4779DRAFT_583415 [Xylariaceae sp. FL0662B]